MPTNSSDQRKKIAALYLQLGTLEESLDNCYALIISLLAQSNSSNQAMKRRRQREAAKKAAQK